MPDRPGWSAAQAADAVDGVPARYVARPASVDELAEVMRAAAADGLAVAVRGGGSKLGWGAPPRSLDVLVDTSGLQGVVEHAAGDLVVTVRPGTPLADLQADLAGARQWLALDPPETGATVGGVVATAASGPRRLLYGPPRDLLIGLTVVLADGTVARSGGKVVKNVAGYDLGKLFTGSFGTLGVIAECTFRLHPVPPARRVVTLPVDGAEDAGGLVKQLLHEPVVPSAVEYVGTGVDVVFEAVEPAAEAQAAAVAAWRQAATVSDTLPAAFGARPWGPADAGLKVGHEIAALTPVLQAVDAVGSAHGLSPRVVSHAATGVSWVAWAADDATTAAAVEALRRALTPYDGSVVVVRATDTVKQRVDVWGPVRGLDLMRRVKQRFDPDGRLAPGRFVGGI